jgi:CBS domain-containing protein
MLVSQLLKTKGDLVFTIHPDETIAAAAAQLVDRRVGALVALDSRDHVAGIMSERDLVRAVADEGAAALERPVSTCMTAEVIFADPSETVDALLSRMTDRRIRHLPVCREGRLVGILSIGDLVKHKIQEAEAEADGLKAYIAAG